MLSTLGGRPLLQWVWEAATAVPLFDTVAFAIDSQETAELIESFGGVYHMTSEECRTGTVRLAELQASGKIKADIWVNWQGDEPFIQQEMIQDLLQSCDEGDVWTLKKKIVNPQDIESPHIPKVVTDAKGFALYFSRCPIPYFRDPNSTREYFKHIGIYAYTSEALKKLSQQEPSPLEAAEKLEQLDFLYCGLRIRVHETQHEIFGIDLPEHLSKAEEYISIKSEFVK